MRNNLLNLMKSGVCAGLFLVMSACGKPAPDPKPTIVSKLGIEESYDVSILSVYEPEFTSGAFAVWAVITGLTEEGAEKDFHELYFGLPLPSVGDKCTIVGKKEFIVGSTFRPDFDASVPHFAVSSRDCELTK